MVETPGIDPEQTLKLNGSMSALSQVRTFRPTENTFGGKTKPRLLRRKKQSGQVHTADLRGDSAFGVLGVALAPKPNGPFDQPKATQGSDHIGDWRSQRGGCVPATDIGAEVGWLAVSAAPETSVSPYYRQLLAARSGRQALASILRYRSPALCSSVSSTSRLAPSNCQLLGIM